MSIKKWRPFLIVFIFLLLFSGLVARLWQVQLDQPHAFGSKEIDLIHQADEQQRQSFLVDSGRGTIYDRQGLALTGERDYHVIVFPLIRKAHHFYAEELNDIAEMLGWTGEQLLQQLRELDQPQMLRSGTKAAPITVTEAQAAHIQRLKIPGIHALYSEQDRYAIDRLAHHVLGTVEFNPERVKPHFSDGRYELTDATGLSGLEDSFEAFLHRSGVNRLSYTVDGKGTPLIGKRTEWINTLDSSEDDAKSIVTTLDADIQRIVEEAMDQPKAREDLQEEAGTAIGDGAAVVLDIANGDVLAMASRPKEGEATEELPAGVNRALIPMEAGSIFKTVIAVAALDQELVRPEEGFYCDGKLDEYNLPCWTFDQGGHGHLTFAEAFAESCNVVFGLLATEVGGDMIETYAHQLGLGRKVGWTGDVYHDDAFAQFPEEKAGQLFHDEQSKQDGYALAQTGIGQRDVKITPLQVANMIVALFHPGKLPHPRVVSELNYTNGDPYFYFEPQIEAQDTPIKAETLQMVRELMLGVVTDGTATDELSDTVWSLGGKTGTAQVGDTGKEHRWMIGYGPVENPQYAVAVVSRHENTVSSNHFAVFRAIMDGLAGQ